MKKILFCLLTMFFLQGTSYGAFNFVDNNNGTVTDARSGLIWLKNANFYGATDSYTARNYSCSNLASGMAGLTDGSVAGQWRIPGLGELQGLGIDSTGTWTMPGEPFINVSGGWYWSSSNWSGPTAWELGMNMATGSESGHHQYDHLTQALVWPVRNNIDVDSDGIVDTSDNCPSVYNPDQKDTCLDGIGDVCRPDTDMDGIPDGCDNCPTVNNPDQADNDIDDIGNECDYKYWKSQYEECKNPTLVKMSSFEVTPSNKSISLKWKTESEIDNAGFNVWRADGFIKITPAMIPSKGAVTEGAEYDYLDLDVFNRKPYFYLLEDVDNNGLSTFHGPVKAVPRAMYGIGEK
ncbi:MAG: DUF1566 domain-containing protein [Pseudomonadota bacterium]